ncbi:hypothetical protein RUM43_008312, partial [Polyplax serrata]
ERFLLLTEKSTIFLVQFAGLKFKKKIWLPNEVQRSAQECKVGVTEQMKKKKVMKQEASMVAFE